MQVKRTITRVIRVIIVMPFCIYGAARQTEISLPMFLNSQEVGAAYAVVHRQWPKHELPTLMSDDDRSNANSFVGNQGAPASLPDYIGPCKIIGACGKKAKTLSSTCCPKVGDGHRHLITYYNEQGRCIAHYKFEGIATGGIGYVGSSRLELSYIADKRNWIDTEAIQKRLPLTAAGYIALPTVIPACPVCKGAEGDLSSYTRIIPLVETPQSHSRVVYPQRNRMLLAISPQNNNKDDDGESPACSVANAQVPQVIPSPQSSPVSEEQSSHSESPKPLSRSASAPSILMQHIRSSSLAPSVQGTSPQYTVPTGRIMTSVSDQQSESVQSSTRIDKKVLGMGIGSVVTVGLLQLLGWKSAQTEQLQAAESIFKTLRILYSHQSEGEASVRSEC